MAFSKSACLSVAVALLSVTASAEAFKDGERVAFYGDSVTHHGYYVTPIQTFYYTRYPDRDIRIWNCGVGGETAREAAWRFDVDIATRKPTSAVILFGMNDVCVLGYATNATDWTRSVARNAPVEFEKSLRRLQGLFAAKLPETKLTWCTLVPWDDELKFPKPRAPITGVTAAEKPLSDIVTRLRGEFGGGYVDYYGPMLAYNKKLHAKDPYASLSPDTIHPKEPGGLFMAKLFLTAQGADGLVSETAVDASALKTAKAENATVSALERTKDGVAFTVLEKCLPYPVDPAARAIADDIGFDAAFNRETLAVAGLADGAWTLAIDGSNVVTKSAAEWAKGVNLAAFETPMMAQARAVADKVAARRAKERDIRGMMVARCVAIRWMFGIPFAEEEKGQDDRFARAFAAGYMKACRDNNFKRMGDNFESMNANWSRLKSMEDEVEKLHAAVRKLNKPASHRYELKK